MAFRAAYMQIKQKKVGRMADIKCRRMVIPGWGRAEGWDRKRAQEC